MIEHDRDHDHDEQPSASGFMSAVSHDCSRPDDDVTLGDDMVRKIAVFGRAACEVDGEEVCETVASRFYGAESGLILEVILTGRSATELGLQLIEQAALARGATSDAE